MDTDSDFVKDDKPNKKLVIFIHGVFGNLRNTWQNPTSHKYWFDLLKEDPTFTDFNILLLGYRSPFWGRGMTLEEISSALLQNLVDDHVFDQYNEIFIISHSMGGLIAQRLLVGLNRPGKERWLRKIHCTILLSTPSNGAPIAELASYISKNPQLKDMQPAVLNSWLQALQNDIVNLRSDRELNNAIFPRFYAAYETLPTHGVEVVSRVYANASTDNPLMAFPLDHQAMAAPAERADRLYKWVSARIVESAGPHSLPGGVAPGFEPVRARAFLVGYDSAFALARFRLGQDITADRATINGNVRLLHLGAAYPPDPLRAEGSTEENGAPIANFVAAVMGALRAVDRRFERAFLLGFYGVISLNTPSVTPASFNFEAFARDAGFDVSSLTEGKASPSAFLDLLAEAERDLIQFNTSTSNTGMSSSVSQTMIESPGGIQVGGNLVLTQRPPARTLKKSQHDQLVAALKEAIPEELGLRHSSGNAESQEYADALGSALNEAGWRLRRARFLIMEHEGYGLAVMVSDPNNPPAGAVRLMSALSAAGLSAQLVEAPIEPGTFDLYVGLQPQ